MKTKREEIRELILRIKEQQEVDKREAEPVPATPSSPGEPEIEETSGRRIYPSAPEGGRGLTVFTSAGEQPVRDSPVNHRHQTQR